MAQTGLKSLWFRFCEACVFFLHTFVAWAYLPIFSILLLYFFWFRILMAAYLVHRFLHKDCQYFGGTRTDFAYSFFYRCMGSYLNAKFVPLGEFPLGHNYLIVAFPHGISAHSHIGCCASKHIPGSEVFAGRPVFFAISSNMMETPFTREYHLACDCIDVSADSLFNVLKYTGRGKFVYILPGGAREATLNSDTIILKNRRGFCRIALQTGTWLVPTFSFGESDLFDNEDSKETSLMYRFQQYMLNNNATVIRNVKGQKWYNLWLTLPGRGPVTIVLGEPIPVEKVENPTKEQINALHQLFISRISEIYEVHKFKYLKDGLSRHLNII